MTGARSWRRGLAGTLAAMLLSSLLAVLGTASPAAAGLPQCPSYGRTELYNGSPSWGTYMFFTGAQAPMAPAPYYYSPRGSNPPYPSASIHWGSETLRWKNAAIACESPAAAGVMMISYFSLPVLPYSSIYQSYQKAGNCYLITLPDVIYEYPFVNAAPSKATRTVSYTTKVTAGVSIKYGDLAITLGMELNKTYTEQWEYDISGTGKVTVYPHVKRCPFYTVETAPNGAQMRIDYGFADYPVGVTTVGTRL